MGTPQLRWREMHQSGRFATMFVMRISPHSGYHFVLLISSSALARRLFWSSAMNHCLVERKTMGLWQRQQWG